MTGAFSQTVSLEPKQDAKKSLWGYVDKSTGKWVVKPVYTSAEPFRQMPDGNTRALVRKGNLQGYLGLDGKPLGAGVVFESIEPVMEGYNLIVGVKGKKGVINPDGVYLQKPEITEISALGNEGYFITSKGKKGFLTPSGETRIAPLYSAIDASVEDVFIVDKGGKAGLLSRTGSVLLEPSKFEKITKFGDYWKVWKGGKAGLFDPRKKVVLAEPKFKDVLEPFAYSGGVVVPVLKPNDKWGAVDTEGNEVLKCKNQLLTPVAAIGAIRVFRNKVGNRLYFPGDNLFLELESWEENDKGPFRVISGKVEEPSESTPDRMVIGLSFAEHMGYRNNFSKRKAAYQNLGKNKSFTMMTDKKGNTRSGVIAVEPLGVNWITVSDSEPWQVYDGAGNLLLTTNLTGPDFISAPSLTWVSDGRNAVLQDLSVHPILIFGNNLQFIDKDDNNSWVALENGKPSRNSGVYSSVSKLEENLVVVKKDGKAGLYNYDGPVLPCEYDSFAQSSRNGIYEVRKNGFIGLYKPDSKTWILSPDKGVKNYEFINSGSGYKILINNGKWGLADLDGNITMKMAYDKDTVLNSLRPKQNSTNKNKPVSKSSKTVTKETEKKRTNVEFQESTEKRR